MQAQKKAGQKRNRHASIKDKQLLQMAEAPLRVGSFILQRFGKDVDASLSDKEKDVSCILASILKRYDLLLLMEARTGAETNIDRLIKRLNTVDRQNPFEFEESEAQCQVHGVTEHYCFFYRLSKLSVIDVHRYGEDPFRGTGWARNSQSSRNSSKVDRTSSPDSSRRKSLADWGHCAGSPSLPSMRTGQAEPANGGKGQGAPYRSASEKVQMKTRQAVPPVHQRERGASWPAKGAGTPSPEDWTAGGRCRKCSRPLNESPDVRMGGQGVEDNGVCSTTPGSREVDQGVCQEDQDANRRQESSQRDPSTSLRKPSILKTSHVCSPSATPKSSPVCSPSPKSTVSDQPSKGHTCGTAGEEEDDWVDHEVTLRKSAPSLNLIDQLKVSSALSSCLWHLEEESSDSSGSTVLLLEAKGQVTGQQTGGQVFPLASPDQLSPANMPCDNFGQTPDVSDIRSCCRITRLVSYPKAATNQSGREPAKRQEMASSSLPTRSLEGKEGNSEVVVATLSGPVPASDDLSLASDTPKRVFLDPIMFSFSGVPVTGSYSPGRECHEGNVQSPTTPRDPAQLREQQPLSQAQPQDQRQGGTEISNGPDVANILGGLNISWANIDDTSITSAGDESEEIDTANNAYISTKDSNVLSDYSHGIWDRNQQNNPAPDPDDDSSDEASDTNVSDEVDDPKNESDEDDEDESPEASKNKASNDSDEAAGSVRFSKRASLKYTPNRFQHLSIAETSAPRRPFLCCCCSPSTSSGIFQKEYKVKIKGDPNSEFSSEDMQLKSEVQKNQNACSRHTYIYDSLPVRVRHNISNIRIANEHQRIYAAGRVNNTDVVFDNMRTSNVISTCNTDAKAFMDNSDKKCLDTKFRSCVDHSQKVGRLGWYRLNQEFSQHFTHRTPDSQSSRFPEVHVAHDGKKAMPMRCAGQRPQSRNVVILEANLLGRMSPDSRTKHRDSRQEGTGCSAQIAEHSHDERVDKIYRENRPDVGTAGHANVRCSVTVSVRNTPDTDKQSVEKHEDSVFIGLGPFGVEQMCAKNEYTGSIENQGCVTVENVHSETHGQCSVDNSSQVTETDSFSINESLAFTEKQRVPSPGPPSGEIDDMLKAHTTIPPPNTVSRSPQLTRTDEHVRDCSDTAANTSPHKERSKARNTRTKTTLWKSRHSIKPTENPPTSGQDDLQRERLEETKPRDRTRMKSTDGDESERTKNDTVTDVRGGISTLHALLDQGNKGVQGEEPVVKPPSCVTADERETLKSERFGCECEWPRENFNSNADVKDKRSGARRKDPLGDDALAQVFCREPFAVLFLSPTTEVTSFAVIAIHTDPIGDAKMEALAIQRLYDVTSNKWHIEDILIAGDFLMVDSGRSMPHWHGLEVKSDRRFTRQGMGLWDEDTAPLCAIHRNYDRMVVAGLGLNKAFISSAVGCYRYDAALSLTVIQTAGVSDHYPIEIQIAGLAKTRWQKHVRASVGVVIEQAQVVPAAVAAELKELGVRTSGRESALSADFSLEVLTDGTSKRKKEVRATRREVTDVVQALRDFQRTFPDVLKEPTVSVAACYMASSFMMASPVHGFRFGSQAPSYDVELTVSLQEPLLCRVSIQRPLCDGLESSERLPALESGLESGM